MSRSGSVASFHARIRFTDLLGSELTKMCTLPMTWIALAVSLAGNLVLGAMAATPSLRVPSGEGLVTVGHVGALMFAPVHSFVALGVLAAGSEFSDGQIRVSLLATPRRNRLLGAKLTVGAAVSLLGAVLVLLPGLLIQHGGRLMDGSSSPAEIGADLATLTAAYALLSLLGLSFALIVRTVVTPLAVLTVAAVLAAPILRSGYPDLVRYLPHEAALSLTNLSGDPAALGRPQSLLVLLAWSGSFIATAWVTAIQRDGGG